VRCRYYPSRIFGGLPRAEEQLVTNF